MHSLIGIFLQRLRIKLTNVLYSYAIEQPEWLDYLCSMGNESTPQQTDVASKAFVKDVSQSRHRLEMFLSGVQSGVRPGFPIEAFGNDRLIEARDIAQIPCAGGQNAKSLQLCCHYYYQLRAVNYPRARRLLVSYAGFAGFQAPAWAAKDLGLFSKYGLSTELVMIPGSARGTQALLEWKHPLRTDRRGTASDRRDQPGADLVLIAASLNKFPFSLVAQRISPSRQI